MDSRDSSSLPPRIHGGQQLQQSPSIYEQLLAHGVIGIPRPQPGDNMATFAAYGTGFLHQQDLRFPYINSVPTAAPSLMPPDRPRNYPPDRIIAPGSSPSLAQFSVTPPEHIPDWAPTPVAVPKNRKLNPLEAYGAGFTPHLITVNPGEDIVSRIMAFSRGGPHKVFVLSATGSISGFTLGHSAMSRPRRFEGPFDIISLSGCFVSSESDGGGYLSVSFSSYDNKVLGGVVSGVLLAGSIVQIILGSFVSEDKKASAVRAMPSAYEDEEEESRLDETRRGSQLEGGQAAGYFTKLLMGSEPE